MSDDDLSAFVDMGKEDVLRYVRENLFSGVSRQKDAASIHSLFFLAVRKSHAELDILRTRSLILQENVVFLSDIKSDDPYIGLVMARAAGRVSQMKECLDAVDRIVRAQTNAVEAMMLEAQKLKASLEATERAAVRFSRDSTGGFALVPLEDMICGEKAGCL